MDKTTDTNGRSCLRCGALLSRFNVEDRQYLTGGSGPATSTDREQARYCAPCWRRLQEPEPQPEPRPQAAKRDDEDDPAAVEWRRVFIAVVCALSSPVEYGRLRPQKRRRPDPDPEVDKE